MHRAIKRGNCCLKTCHLFFIWKLSECRKVQCLHHSPGCYAVAISICMFEYCYDVLGVCDMLVVKCQLGRRDLWLSLRRVLHLFLLCSFYIHIKVESIDAIFSFRPHPLILNISSCLHRSIIPPSPLSTLQRVHAGLPFLPHSAASVGSSYTSISL